jgi:hypothetical protein
MSKKSVALAGLLLLLMVGGLLWSTNLYGRQSRAKGLDNAVEIVESSAVEGAIRIALKNTSSKNINALQVAVGGNVFFVEFLDADEPKQKLSPGGIYQEWFPITGSAEVEVSVLAAVFDDKTGIGEERLVDEVLETRRGVKKHLEKFGNALRQMLNSPGADSLAVVQKLNDELDGLIEDSPADSGPMRLGQRKAKQQSQNELEAIKRTALKDPTRTIRMGLTSLERRNTRRITNLQ